MARTADNPPPPDEPSDSFNELFAHVPSTGRHVIQSLPPTSPEREAMTQWISSVEKRLGGSSSGGGGGQGPKSDPPVAKHLLRTKQLVDFGKYVIALIIGIAALGWMGREYVDDFQTEEEAEEAQTVNDDAHTAMQRGIDDNGASIGNLRVYNVRIELEQRNANERLDQLLELEQAETRQERVRARRRVAEIQRSIDQRERIIQNPPALQRVADRLDNDPLGGLEGL